MNKGLPLRVIGAMAVVMTLAAASPPESPVADAAMRGDTEAARTLLRGGADVNAAQGDGMTALHWAAERADAEMAEMLLYAGARVGAVTRIGDLLTPGRKSLVNLWATWCVPCAQEMPELEQLYPGLRASGVDLIGVSVDLETLDHVPEYVASREISYPIYTTDPAVMESLFPRGEVVVPVTALLDETGRVLEIYSGWSRQSEESLRALVTR